MFRSLSHLLIDQSCYSCTRWLTAQEQFVCLHCHSQLQLTRFHENPTDNELYFRLAGRIPLAGATSLCYFDKKGRLQRLMQALKYQEAAPLGPYLGNLLGEELRDSAFAAQVDAVLPVPLHWRKQLSRGYNQAALIAQGLCEYLTLPLHTDLLLRKRSTATQARQAGASRWLNVSSAFHCDQPLPASILLIDDVITTGATLEACIRALMASPQPPKQIRVASIGMARRS